MSVWDDIAWILEEGREPVVWLPASWLKPREKGKPGRPRKDEKLTSLEKLARPLLGDLSRPRCRNPKCRKRLKSGQRYVCSDECRELAISYHQAVVNLLEHNGDDVEEVPSVWEIDEGGICIDGDAIKRIRESFARSKKRDRAAGRRCRVQGKSRASGSTGKSNAGS